MDGKKSEMDKVYQKVKGYIEQHQMLEIGDQVLVGVSGGADSVCLLLMLQELAREMELILQCVTVHHGIRGKAADQDLAFVEELCLSYGIPCSKVYVDVPALVKAEGYSEEEAGRMLRYQCFERIGTETGCKLLALAHHEDDQCETVLHHLIRGSSLKGLSAMAPVRQQGKLKLIRPLLCITRGEIESWLLQRKQTWCLDETNLETTYTRNFIRQILIPELKEKGNAQASKHIVQAAEDIREAQLFLEAQACEWLQRNRRSGAPLAKYPRKKKEEAVGIAFSSESFLELADVLRREVLIQCIKGVCNGRLPQNISRVHLQQVICLAGQGQHGKQVGIPGNVIAYCSYGDVIIERKRVLNKDPEADDLSAGKMDKETRRGEWLVLGEDLRILVEDQALLQGLTFSLADYEDKKIWSHDYTKCFDYGKMKGVLCLRTRRTGDYFVLESGGRKSLKSYMIDQKIPAQERDQIPLLAEGSHVWWIGTGRVSATRRMNSESRKILVLRQKGD